MRTRIFRYALLILQSFLGIILVLQSIGLKYDTAWKNYLDDQSSHIIYLSNVKDKYKDDLEFLWEKSSSAIVRRKDNKKWYAVFQIVSKRKIGIESDEIVELLGLRASANLIPDLIDNKLIFKGFHMNKKNWISICLDGSVNENSIFKMIDESYDLAKISK